MLYGMSVTRALTRKNILVQMPEISRARVEFYPQKCFCLFCVGFHSLDLNVCGRGTTSLFLLWVNWWRLVHLFETSGEFQVLCSTYWSYSLEQEVVHSSGGQGSSKLLCCPLTEIMAFFGGVGRKKKGWSDHVLWMELETLHAKH